MLDHVFHVQTGFKSIGITSISLNIEIIIVIQFNYIQFNIDLVYFYQIINKWIIVWISYK